MSKIKIPEQVMKNKPKIQDYVNYLKNVIKFKEEVKKLTESEIKTLSSELTHYEKQLMQMTEQQQEENGILPTERMPGMSELGEKELPPFNE